MINIIIVSLITLFVSLFFESYVSNEHTYKIIYGAGNTKKNVSFNNLDYIIGTEEINLEDDHTSLPKQIKLFKYLKDTILFNQIPFLFYEDLKYSYKYDNYHLFKPRCHYGQRKLLLNEIQFLTYYAKQTNIIIYVGAAPCEHLTVIKHLFPNNKYLLIDPNYCIIDEDKAVYIYQNPHIISTNAINIYKTYSSIYKPKHQQNGAKKLTNRKVLFKYNNKTYNMISPFLNKSNLNNHIKEMENIKKEAISIMSTKNIFNIIENNSDYDIFIIQDYLDINLLELISLNINEVKSNILFISDLRTSFWSEIKENNISEISGPVDADILHNDSLQMLALHYIKPTYAMLKFHPPLFYESWVKYSTFLKKNSIMYNVVKQVSVNIFNKDEDYLFNEHINKKHYNYKAERILLQPWAPSGSTEARLIISKKTIINKDVVLYSSSEWENKYLIFNITRSYVSIPTYLELITIYTQSHNYKDFKKHGYDSCPDCFIELTILYQYCKKQANIHFKNIWNYIPNTSEQQDLFTNLKKVCDILYNNLPFLIIKFKNSTSSETHLYEKLNSNKKCTLHGHNFSHKENHLFFQIKNNATYPNTKKLYKVIISKYNEPNVKLIKSKHDLQMYENYDEDISNKLIKKIIDNYPPPHTELKGGFNTNLDNILKINYKINLPELETPITNIWERTDIQVNNVLQKMYFEQAVYDKNNKKIKYNSGVGPIEGWHLYNLVKSNQFNKILEVGMAYGTSALFMCQALKENNAPGYLISIDPNQSTQWEGIGRLNIERAGLLKYHRIMETTSDKAMAYLLSSNIDGDAPESFDMVFVDGMHLFDYTLLDIYFAAKLVRLYGVIVIDDIRHKWVAKAIKYINLNYKFLKLIEINVASQTMATYVKIADDTRLWNFHIEF